MDGTGFDALTRTLATGTTRRGVLRTGLALAGAALGLGGLAGAEAAGRRRVGSPCTRDSHCVTGVCGPAGARWKECQCASAGDCPAPANPCAVATCAAGACVETPGNAGAVCGTAATGCGLRVCPGDSTTCGPDPASCAGETPDCCGDGCTSFQTDPANCGGCGVACAATEACVDGRCFLKYPHCGGRLFGVALNAGGVNLCHCGEISQNSPCDRTADCPSGNWCHNFGLCTPGCFAG